MQFKWHDHRDDLPLSRFFMLQIKKRPPRIIAGHLLLQCVDGMQHFCAGDGHIGYFATYSYVFLLWISLKSVESSDESRLRCMTRSTIPCSSKYSAC